MAVTVQHVAAFNAISLWEKTIYRCLTLLIHMHKEKVVFSFVFAPLASVIVVAVESIVRSRSTSKNGGN